MSLSPTRPEVVIVCPEQCSFHPDKIGPGISEALRLVRQNGAGQNVFKRRAEELLGHTVPGTNVQRHLLHYKVKEDPDAPAIDPSKKMGDLDILDLVIQRGAINSANWKPTIKDTIEAMKLKMQMTGNSAFDDLKALFDGIDADEVIAEADQAEKALLEGSEEAEPLAEPLL